MTWAKGQSGNPAGRKKGSKNKYSHLKAEFLEAFDRLGGVDGLVTWVEEDSTARRKVFYDWIVRLMPNDISIETERHSITEYSPEELAALASNRAA